MGIKIDPRSKQFRAIERFFKSLPKPVLRTFRLYLNKPRRKLDRYAIMLGCTKRTVYNHLQLVDERLERVGRKRPKYFPPGKPKRRQRLARIK